MNFRLSVMGTVVTCALGLLIAPGCSVDAGTEKGADTDMEKPATQQQATKDLPKLDYGPGAYAVFNTSEGRIVCRLFPDKAPLTCENFIGLAEGAKEWTDPKTGRQVKRPFYDGLTFHRVIPNFMIQGGCPLGTGSGGPGYKFKDEFDPSLKFDRPGLLAMANSGPGTNGSQFFITEVPTPHLNNKHTIFGEVVEGLDLIEKIAVMGSGQGNQRVPPIVIEKLEIERIEK